jgi:hypothetical protein
MASIFSNWFLRRKIDAHVRLSGKAMEHRRIVNPYHAVSIEPGLKCCKDAGEMEGRRFLASAAPNLPLRNCEKAKCTCRYVHHNDRRNSRERRVQPHNPHGHIMRDRRTSGGRRAND